MPDFLLEIGCEEIPARMLDDARKELVERVSNLLMREHLLSGVSIQAGLSTPRRLALLAQGVPLSQPDVRGRVQGPSLNVGYKDGKPTPAAEAFAKRSGVEVSALEREVTHKGEYLVATVTRKGRSVAEVLAEALPKEIASIYWPKTMYWRAGKPERFVRPIRWMVAMLDSEVVPLEFAGIKAGSQTYGHRLWSTEPQAIAQAEQYERVLAGARVIVNSRDREKRIRDALDAATLAIPGACWRQDAELMETVVNLTEWPFVILGSFDRQFLDLQEEVLVTVMRQHQKYFAVENIEGKLAPRFLAVLNTDGDPDGLIRQGNERVLRARFNDAQFFWNADNASSFVDRRTMLDKVTFQTDLGNYYEKTERTATLIEGLAAALIKANVKIDRTAAIEAGKYSKNDLTTELVKEFPELQGIIGGVYARKQGSLSETAALAIYDQYKPTSMEDSVPRTREGAVLSIADKADSITGMFALGLVPSGSKDPFALRRQANGIVKTIAEHKLPINLADLMEDARTGYRHSEAEKKFTLGVDAEAYFQALSSFFRERLEFYLRDARGLPYDVVNATLAAGADDVVDAVARATAVAKVRLSADFESISTAFKRMKNILLQAEETKKKVAEPFNPALLEDDEEKKLGAAIPQVAASVNKLRAAKQYGPALLEISRLRPAIDAFFDKVMVMVDDENLRANRLGLLQTLVREFSSIADFSEIVTEKK